MKKFVILIAAMVIILGLSVPAHAFLINFENGVEGQAIAGIPGVAFTQLGQNNWRYGDSRTGSYSTRSIDLGYGSGSYQHYGNLWAWLGVSGPSGKIDFTNNDGTWFQTGYTSYGPFYVEGYDSNGVLLDSASGSANYGGADMGWLRIDAPQGQYLDYIIVHDSGNYFLMDNMSGDSTGVGSQTVPEPATMSLFGLGLVGLLGKLRKKNS
jgi:hypothetical protein